MTRMSADNYGLCRTAEGRSIPCSQPLGNGIAQLALMLRGAGMFGQGYGGGWNGSANTNQPVAADNQRPAYENSWASIADNSGRFEQGSHLPITKAQEILLPSVNPYIETLPWRPYAPEYIPIPPQVRPLPTMPDEIGPGPFIGPNLMKPYANPDEDWPFPDTEECEDEIDKAHKFCRAHVRKLKSGLDTGNFGNTITQCMRGMLSEECGGNPVRIEA